MPFILVCTDQASYTGLLLREKNVHNPNTGSFWATSLLFSLVQELIPAWNNVTAQLDGKFIGEHLFY